MTIAIFVAAAVVTAGLFSFLAWEWGDGESGMAVEDAPDHEKIDWILPTGSYTQVTSGTVTPAGGSIIAPSGVLNGLRIDAPNGAARENIAFRVSYAEVDTSAVKGLPQGASIASKMISIETSGSASWNTYKMFDRMVKVTLPYDPSMVRSYEQGVRFYQFDALNGSLEPTGFAGQDLNANTLSFQAGTFSRFVAVELALSVFEDLNSSLSVDTGFRPKNDGWFIPNYGSYLESGGACLGMTSYAKWFFTHHKEGNGAGLYQSYREGNINEWRDDATAIQLATRAQMGTAGIYSSLTQAEQTNLSSKQVGVSIIHGMLVSREPQLIGLMTRYTDGTYAQGGHAILAYRYADGRFDVYDPNNPGTSAGTDQQQIPFNYSNGFSRIFKSGLNAANPLQFNVFYHASAKVFSPNNAYQGLYDMAKKRFSDSSIFPEVKLTDEGTDPIGTTPVDSNRDGVRDTTSNKVTITGTISGGRGNITSTLVLVSGQMFQAAIDPTTGAFTVEVPLFQGTNDVVVLATDDNTFTNWAGFLRDRIKSTASAAALTMTLTWGQSDSDVDLHIQEPMINGTVGRHIYYSNKGMTGTTPYLDFDNTRGYGPEHYYATDDSMLPDPSSYGQYAPLYGTYLIKVHYYSDHDGDDEAYQPITWHLSIQYLAFRNEATGEEYWGYAEYSGYLAIADSTGAGSFSSTGPAWSSVMSFQYLEPVPANYNVPDPPQNAFD